MWETGYLEELIRVLGNWGVRFEEGLTDAEVAAAENRFGFVFPPDLRQFLQFALPVGRRWPGHGGDDTPIPSSGWPDWRDGADAGIHGLLHWPLEGICYDIEHNAFWMEEWGPKPADLAAAFEIARQAVAAAPTLIPIVGHRYLPAEPCEAGNPILSVMQTDIIYYSLNLTDFFTNAEALGDRRDTVKELRPIRFWHEFCVVKGFSTAE